jgi:dTMP kinase
MARADTGGQKSRDSIGQETLDFHRRVREGFLEIARVGGERYVIIDAERPVEEVAAAAWKAVLERLR